MIFRFVFLLKKEEGETFFWGETELLGNLLDYATAMNQDEIDMLKYVLRSRSLPLAYHQVTLTK